MRFTIRDLLWLTVVVALGVAWWLDRSRLTAEIKREQRQNYDLKYFHQMLNPLAPATYLPKK